MNNDPFLLWLQSQGAAGRPLGPVPMPSDFGSVESEFAAWQSGAVVFDFSERTQLAVTGPDRRSFLHNLCSNDIQNLGDNTGCEAFFLNAQGHILAYAMVFNEADQCVIETVAGQGQLLWKHLEKYHIREKVEITDQSAAWGELLVSGPLAGQVLTQALPGPLPTELGGGTSVAFAGCVWRVRAVDFSAPREYLFSGPRAALLPLAQHLVQAGASLAGFTVWNAARIERHTPLFGTEIGPKALPQELDRNERAIHFRKGCYLGQETVARIDALGHVNRLLRLLAWTGKEIPTVGMSLQHNGTSIGEVTSAAYSQVHNRPVALAYIKRGHAAPGTQVETPLGPAEILP